jgi:spermidine/putrescine transport system ATP-binding protein
MGGYTYYVVNVGSENLRVSRRNDVSRGKGFDLGQNVKIGFRSDSVRVLSQ